MNSYHSQQRSCINFTYCLEKEIFKGSFFSVDSEVREYYKLSVRETRSGYKNNSRCKMVACLVYSFLVIVHLQKECCKKQFCTGQSGVRGCCAGFGFLHIPFKKLWSALSACFLTPVNSDFLHVTF